MGCTPSSTFPAGPRKGGATGPSSSFAMTPSKGPLSRAGGDDVSLSRARGVASGTHTQPRSVGSVSSQPLRVQSSAEVPFETPAPSPETTTYVTATGKRMRFKYGRPVGFQGAQEIIACLDEFGLDGNLYRLVRSKLRSVGEVVSSGSSPALQDDTSSQREAQERGRGLAAVAQSVTARRRHPSTAHRVQTAATATAAAAGTRTSSAAAADDVDPDEAEEALQNQYVVALLGLDAIHDTSAVRAARRSSGYAPPAPLNAMAAAQPAPSPPPNPNAADARTETAAPTPAAAQPTSADEDEEDEDDVDYVLNPQAHYSALPAQRKAGGAVPVALSPPSRTTRVPLQYSAVEDHVVVKDGSSAASTATASSGGAEGQKNWIDHVRPQRVFRLDTSETRTWAFYNDSPFIMHVFALFDAASKLEPRDSTRLWPSSVFDAGSAEFPAPPPFFFGLFFDDEGDEVVPGSEFPESSARRHRGMFGSRGTWVAELLVPPGSTRVFVEGKVRGAYRMRCTRIELDEVLTATETAIAVARKRELRYQQTHPRPKSTNRASWSPRTLRSGSGGGGAGGRGRQHGPRGLTSPPPPARPLSATLTSPPSSERRVPAVPASAAAPEAAATTTPAPAFRFQLHAPAARGSTEQGSRPSSRCSSAERLDASVRTMAPGQSCYSTLEVSQGVLTRQTYTHRPSSPAPAALASATAVEASRDQRKAVAAGGPHAAPSALQAPPPAAARNAAGSPDRLLSDTDSLPDEEFHVAVRPGRLQASRQSASPTTSGSTFPPRSQLRPRQSSGSSGKATAPSGDVVSIGEGRRRVMTPGRLGAAGLPALLPHLNCSGTPPRLSVDGSTDVYTTGVGLSAGAGGARVQRPHCVRGRLGHHRGAGVVRVAGRDGRGEGGDADGGAGILSGSFITAATSEGARGKGEARGRCLRLSLP